MESTRRTALLAGPRSICGETYCPSKGTSITLVVFSSQIKIVLGEVVIIE